MCKIGKTSCGVGTSDLKMCIACIAVILNNDVLPYSSDTSYMYEIGSVLR